MPNRSLNSFGIVTCPRFPTFIFLGMNHNTYRLKELLLFTSTLHLAFTSTCVTILSGGPMRPIALSLLLSASLCAQIRYARLGEIDGNAETQIHPSEPWRSALRNTPLRESSWIRTGGVSH